MTKGWVGPAAVIALALAAPLEARGPGGTPGRYWTCGPPARPPSACSCPTRTPRRAAPTAARRSTPAAGAETLAKNPLIDFVFLNLEGAYDRDAVMAVSEGLGKKGTPGRKTMLVRIPSLVDAGPR